jgi:hypothetical protein
MEQNPTDALFFLILGRLDFRSRLDFFTFLNVFEKLNKLYLKFRYLSRIQKHTLSPTLLLFITTILNKVTKK